MLIYFTNMHYDYKQVEFSSIVIRILFLMSTSYIQKVKIQSEGKTDHSIIKLQPWAVYLNVQQFRLENANECDLVHLYKHTCNVAWGNVTVCPLLYIFVQFLRTYKLPFPRADTSENTNCYCPKACGYILLQASSCNMRDNTHVKYIP